MSVSRSDAIMAYGGTPAAIGYTADHCRGRPQPNLQVKEASPHSYIIVDVEAKKCLLAWSMPRMEGQDLEAQHNPQQRSTRDLGLLFKGQAQPLWDAESLITRATALNVAPTSGLSTVRYDAYLEGSVSNISSLGYQTQEHPAQKHYLRILRSGISLSVFCYGKAPQIYHPPPQKKKHRVLKLFVPVVDTTPTQISIFSLVKHESHMLSKFIFHRQASSQVLGPHT